MDQKNVNYKLKFVFYYDTQNRIVKKEEKKEKKTEEKLNNY